MTEPQSSSNQDQPKPDTANQSAPIPQIETRHDLKEEPPAGHGDEGGDIQPPPGPPPIPPAPAPIVINLPAPEPSRLSITDWITAVSTLIIMIWGGIQVDLMYSGEAETTAIKVAAQQQACAAQHSADAAQQFADTAVSINGGIGDAVTKLDAQAKAIEASKKSSELASAKALKATIDNFYIDQRPWVGIEIVPAALPPNFIRTGPGITTSTVIIMAHNTGHTPALRWRSECCETVVKEVEESVPDYDALVSDLRRHISPTLQAYMAAHPAEVPRILQGLQEQQDIQSRYFAETAQVIPPNGTHGLDFTSVNGNDHKFHYTVGKMVYWDLLDPTKEHVTNFCLVSLGDSPLRLCDGGQDMN